MESERWHFVWQDMAEGRATANAKGKLKPEYLETSFEEP
jgi:hypothetical protein